MGRKEGTNVGREERKKDVGRKERRKKEVETGGGMGRRERKEL